MIAMALMNSPELVIADEPTTALDVTIQAQILHLLAGLQRELGMAMILITHNLGVVARVADRVAIMYAGEIVETAPTAELFAAPRHPYTRGLLDCLQLGSIPGMVPSLVGEVRGCAFAARCPQVQPVCRTDAPPIRQRGAGHSYRCVLRDEPRHGMETAAAGSVSTIGSEVMLAARNVSASYEVSAGFLRKQTLRALRDVTLELRKGEIFALVGESGCGKSTLARVLLGLLRADTGAVQLSGEPLSGFKPLARRVQPVFQDPYSSLNPRKTVAEIIRRPLDLHRIGTPAERRRELARMMELTGLPERLAGAYPNQISGGQRQRVAIARAIIMKPEIVLCDEPTSALDVSVQSQILKLLLELRDELGLTYLFITHDLSVVRQLATRIAVMYLGEIVEIGDARSVLDAPRHPYTRALLESVMTVAPGAGVPDTRIGHSFPNPLDIPSGCAFHPRCPAAMPECSGAVPLATRHDAVTVRCHLYR
jgi:peptide/nickel transport system ATP-binding protein